ncbi:MAG: hypothetical protein ACRC7S_19600 [Cetobacterium sp.]
MSTTNYLGLNIPDKNSKGRVVTEVFEPNFTKLDQNAEVVDRDKNAIWGGLDGGGLIEDPSVTKVVGKRYIGADGKAYICRVPSNINNSTNYTPCNVVDNLDKLQNLFKFYTRKNGNLIINISLTDNFCIASFFIEATNPASEFYFQTNGTLIDLFSEFEVRIRTPFQGAIGIIQGKTSDSEKLPLYIRCNEDGKLIFVGSSNITGKHGTFGTICFSIRK